MLVVVIATKYSTSYKTDCEEIIINSQGNGTKSLHVSVNESLKKLQTDYIDLVLYIYLYHCYVRPTDTEIQLYVHWWDGSTSIPELMQSLNRLVLAGKVLYLGISDTPAWVVSKANEYARNHGLRQFSVYQGRWSAASRDFEREIIAMTKAEGMSLAPWGALGGGKFKTEEQRQRKSIGRAGDITETEIRVSRALESVAIRRNTIITSVAQAYVMHKAPYVFPIIGTRTKEHLKANIEALTLILDDEDIREIESAVPFELGFPSSFLYGPQLPDHPGKVWVLNMGGTTDYVNEPKPITPKKAGE